MCLCEIQSPTRSARDIAVPPSDPSRPLICLVPIMNEENTTKKYKELMRDIFACRKLARPTISTFYLRLEGFNRSTDCDERFVKEPFTANIHCVESDIKCRITNHVFDFDVFIRRHPYDTCWSRRIYIRVCVCVCFSLNYESYVCDAGTYLPG